MDSNLPAFPPELIQGEPPRDGQVYQTTMSFPMRWKAYSPHSQQFKHGIKGRWQMMNEYGGWDNSDGAGRYWPFVGYLLSHREGSQHE